MSNARLAFTPNLLHPRFAPPLAGRAAWLACWADALALAAQRGAHKRLGPTAAWPARFNEQVHGQLARRVGQEAELLFERARARSAWVGGGESEGEGPRSLRRSPVGRLSEAEWGRVTAEGHLGGLLDQAEGREVAGVVRLGPGGIAGAEEDQLSWLLPLHDPSSAEPPFMSPPSAPVYNIAAFLDSPALPPSAAGAGPLSGRAHHWLAATVALFARREADAGPSQTSREAADAGGVFVIYNPSRADSELPVAGGDDVVPLLQALWRCRLWVGEGWEGQPEGGAEEAEP